MVVEALGAFRVLAGALGVLAGLALLFAPRGALREPTRFRRWLLEFDCAALLDRRRTIERFSYRHHRTLGVLVIAGALASIAVLGRFGAQAVPALAPVLGKSGVVALSIAAWTSVLFAFFIGLFLLIRPSALKWLEAAANRWIDPFPEKVGEGIRASYDIVGRSVQRFPKLVGLLLFTAGLLCFDVFTQ